MKQEMQKSDATPRRRKTQGHCAVYPWTRIKKGKATDYVAKQYIGNLGKTKNGIVSVNTYAVVEGITYPLLFKIFKPKKCLKAEDTYKTKPQLAIEIIKELQIWNMSQPIWMQPEIISWSQILLDSFNYILGYQLISSPHTISMRAIFLTNLMYRYIH